MSFDPSLSVPVSVVIPTCNRKSRLLSLLRHIDQLTCRPAEVIIVDSGEEQLTQPELLAFAHWPVRYVMSEKSVCIQRNIGIAKAVSPWILLCDDDIELPPDYLQKLLAHAAAHPRAGAISGVWLEKTGEEWKASHPEKSARVLTWKYIFHLGIWGDIEGVGNNFFTSRIKAYYNRKGNHISKAGWPVLTQFGGDYFTTPVYSLGGALVKKEWLINSPYDEVLDRHGIGDNYGVAVDFPSPGIHIVTGTCVYHHLEPANRLKRSLQYFRRALALDYFLRTKSNLKHVKRSWLLWSLTGNLLIFIAARDGIMIKASMKAIWKILINKNPYYSGRRSNKNIIEPLLRFNIMRPRQAYNRWSASYDQQPANTIMGMDQELFGRLTANISFAGKTVVDIGCGTGRHWKNIFEKHPAKLIGYDVSEGMLQQLQKKFPHAETYLLQSGRLHGSADQSIDLIISTLTIAHIENLPEAFSEWNRVLKQGGDIIITDFHPGTLSKGGKRTFSLNNRQVEIKSFVYSIEQVQQWAREQQWQTVSLIELAIDDSVKDFFERNGLLHVFERNKGLLIVYGIHLNKRNVATEL